ncbi:GNAT family N-acetyltransferase [Streptomyces sp. NPDC102394]|uniref:GNAT family N-acetyltransferase n=1 Tax=Streptomyces sp. NPDC102394 TaxID=3366167 RepID=UPI0037FD9A64
MLQGLEMGLIGATLARALDHGHDAILRDLAVVLQSPEPSWGSLSASLGLLLVAVDSTGQVVGALLAHPPTSFLLNLAGQGLEQKNVFLGHIAIAKIKGLAVAENSRHSGIGSALLRRCREVYWQCGYELLYGQFHSDRGLLPSFYRASDFEVLSENDGVDLWVVFGQRVVLTNESGERVFYRWRRYSG